MHKATCWSCSAPQKHSCKQVNCGCISSNWETIQHAKCKPQHLHAMESMFDLKTQPVVNNHLSLEINREDDFLLKHDNISLGMDVTSCLEIFLPLIRRVALSSLLPIPMTKRVVNSNIKYSLKNVVKNNQS